MTIKIIISGPRGRMGKEAIKMIEKNPQFELVACIDRKHDGKILSDLEDMPAIEAPIFVEPENCFKSVSADIFLELSVPEVGFEHTKLALMSQLRAVVGTSGFTEENIQLLTSIANKNQVGCIIAPNFAMGAVLMMQFAEKAAAYFPDVEIIEKHHDQKLDAPSGTAKKTAQMIQNVRDKKQQGHPDEIETIEGARGAEIDGIRIHSVRLPGLVAHQEVILGGLGQTLTITHDSYNRQSFMTGVKFALHKVMDIHTLVYGLENVMD